MTLHTVASVCHYVIAALIIAKMSETFYHMVRYHDYASSPPQGDWKSVFKEWPITFLFSVVFHFAPGAMRRFLFRFHVLVTALILVLFLFPRDAGAGLSAIALFLSIWIQLIRIIVDQIKYGSSAYLSGPPISGPAVSNPLYEHHFGGRGAKRRLRGFLRLFLGLFVIVVLGFAALYFYLQHNLAGGAFTGLSDDSSFWPLDCIYFSLVTIATVGFGDVIPLPSALPRLLVATEIIAGFLLLIVLITTVSLTFQELPNGGREKDN